jgi:hypothetical protein
MEQLKGFAVNNRSAGATWDYIGKCGEKQRISTTMPNGQQQRQVVDIVASHQTAMNDSLQAQLLLPLL